MVVTSQRGETRMTVRGPETKAWIAGIPQDADFVGIQFRLGAFMPGSRSIHSSTAGSNCLRRAADPSG
jgi:hypothetical protein